MFLKFATAEEGEEEEEEEEEEKEEEVEGWERKPLRVSLLIWRVIVVAVVVVVVVVVVMGGLYAGRWLLSSLTSTMVVVGWQE